MFLFSRSNNLSRHLLQQLFRCGKCDRWTDNPGVLKKIKERSVWLPTRFDDRDEGDLKVRNNGIEFLRNRWPARIHDDKARQTSERFDCFCIVEALWSLKVKDDRQIFLFS